MSSPLSGWSVVVTRSSLQADGLVELLQAKGASVVAMPTIAIVDPDDGGVYFARRRWRTWRTSTGWCSPPRTGSSV